MLRVGILTSGGDCQGLNASIRGVAKSLYEEYKDEVEIYGVKDGYKGLIFDDCKLMKQKDFSGILTIGGTILGTSRQPFKLMRVVDETSLDKVKEMKATYKKRKFDCLIILGGNGTQKTANLLREEGLNVIHLPKTIDNDVFGTDMTFGFHSSVEVAANVLDCIHSTATSHGRVFLVEIMGHKVGWLPLYAGIAGGADIILLPEIPYDIQIVAKEIKDRSKSGKDFSIIAVAEGAISKKEASMSKKEYKKYKADLAYPSVAYQIAKELSAEVENEVKVCVPGHFQRGGSPCAYDRVLCTRLGTGATKCIKEKNFGVMIGLINGEIVPVPLENCAGKLKTVPTDCQEIMSAREIGVSFGDK
ncbi:MAG: 6-phosphofructokinase [Clostridia bacterium]